MNDIENNLNKSIDQASWHTIGWVHEEIFLIILTLMSVTILLLTFSSFLQVFKPLE